MPLDSDVSNADSFLHVEFYHYRSVPTKRWPNRDAAALEDSLNAKPFIRVMTPGEKNNIVERPVRESDKERFPRQWINFQRENSEEEVFGTKLAVWHGDASDDVTMGQIDELHVLKFDTVEQIASASDGQLQKMGMGGIGLRNKAKAYLASKAAQTGSAELTQMRNDMAELRAMLAAATAKAPEIAAPKRRGPKPGYRKAKPHGDDDAATHAASNG